jgi:hypothetical protein
MPFPWVVEVALRPLHVSHSAVGSSSPLIPQVLEIDGPAPLTAFRQHLWLKLIPFDPFVRKTWSLKSDRVCEELSGLLSSLYW